MLGVTIAILPAIRTGIELLCRKVQLILQEIPFLNGKFALDGIEHSHLSNQNCHHLFQEGDNLDFINLIRCQNLSDFGNYFFMLCFF